MTRYMYDAFRVNRDQVMDFEILLKSIQTSLILSQCPPKPNVLLKFLISFVTTVKSRHAPTVNGIQQHLVQVAIPFDW